MAGLTKLKTQNNKAKFVDLIHTTEGFATSFDGTRIYYKSSGQGIPIICCNGLGCSTIYFSYFENYFRNSFQVITWDYRGHGHSEAPRKKENHTIESLSRDLKAVMSELKISKAIMVGHSMGVQVLYEFYEKNPSACIALIPCFGTFERPIDTFLDSPFSKYIFELIYAFNLTFPKASNLIGTLMVKNPLWFQMGSLFKMMKPYLVDRKIMEQYLKDIVKVDPVFLTKLTRDFSEHTAEACLKKVHIPTLILGAEDDTFTPVWLSKKMHHLVPNSELFIVKKGSHVALVEQPELINLRIEKFIQERVLRGKERRAQKSKKKTLKMASRKIRTGKLALHAVS